MSVAYLIHQEFPQDPSLIYLNHAAVAPWPQRTALAVKSFAEENVHIGSLHYPQWLAVENELRQRLAQLINASSIDEISLIKNTSEGLSIVAQGLSWQHGDNIVIPKHEFPSNRIVWDSLSTLGVQLREIDIQNSLNPEQTLLNACDQNTRLLSVSAVQYIDGFRLNLAQLGEFCHKHSIYFCIDAIQQIGALRFDVQAAFADFVAADGHKWMMAPEGLGVFYCRAELRERLTLRQYGWHMTRHPGDYMRQDWSPADSGKRFEAGSPNMLGIYALHASIGLLLETGMENVEARLLGNIEHLTECIARRHDLELLSNYSMERRSGIVNFRHRTLPVTRLHQHLMDNRVLCAQRGSGIRFSPHFYQSHEQLEQSLSYIPDS